MTTSGVGVPNIVVVGGGAGGLELVTLLGNALGKPKLARVYLVDNSQTHLWKPLLHEVAVGSLDTGIHELSYREHAYRHDFSFHLGTMDRLFLNEQCIQLAPP